MKTLSEIYDGFATTYEQNRGIFDMTEVINDLYGGLNISTGHLLDLGCGAGEPFARFFLDRGWQVTGVDFSAKMLELAARYAPQMHAIYSDMRNLDFEPDKFNAVAAVYSLFHVPRADHRPLFEKINQWLKPDGRFLFTYATQLYTGKETFEGYKEFLGEELFYSHKTPQQLYADLQDTGFQMISTSCRNIGSEVFLWVTAGKPTG